MSPGPRLVRATHVRRADDPSGYVTAGRDAAGMIHLTAGVIPPRPALWLAAALSLHARAAMEPAGTWPPADVIAAPPHPDAPRAAHTVVKLRSAVEGARVRESVFVGPDEGHLQLAGTLLLELGEWQLIGAALMLGQERLNHHLHVTAEGDAGVCAAFQEKEEEKEENEPAQDN